MLLAAGLTEAEVEVKIEAKVETLLAPANDYGITLSVFTPLIINGLCALQLALPASLF
jgi:hypothetical protein